MDNNMNDFNNGTNSYNNESNGYNSYNQYTDIYTGYNVVSDDLSGNAKVFSALAYINLFFLIGLLVEPDNKNPFVRHHVNNGIVLTLTGAVVGVICSIPIIGWIIGVVAGPILVIVGIIGIVKAATGSRFNIPYLSNIKLIK